MMSTLEEIEEQFSSKETIESALQQRFPLISHPGFLWKSDQSGYKNYAFGAQVGPRKTLSGLAHEMAHAVEFGPLNFGFRVNPYSGTFDFRVRKMFCIDAYYDQPLTGQCSEREARTFGIEARLLELLTGVELHKPSYFQTCFQVRGFLPDWIAYEDEPEQYAQLIEQAYQRYTTDRCLADLKRWFDKTHLRLRLRAIRQAHKQKAA